MNKGNRVKAGVTENSSVEDAQQVLSIYQRIPQNKKQIFLVALDAFMAGMEARERMDISIPPEDV